MSYAIGHLVYGLPVLSEVSEKAKEVGVYLGEGDDDDDQFGKGVGFELLYTGSYYEAGFLGKELLEFDVCVDFHKLSQLEEAKLSLSDIDKTEVVGLVQEFQTEYPALAQIYTNMGVGIDFYIVWSYS